MRMNPCAAPIPIEQEFIKNFVEQAGLLHWICYNYTRALEQSIAVYEAFECFGYRGL